MPRPRTGKNHVGERRERRKNGDVYVYERTTAYDPKTKKTVTVSERLKGKIKAGTEEIVPTRPKRKKGETAATEAATRKHTGTTDILQWAGSSSGIDEAARGSLERGDADKAISLARYLVATSGESLTRLESWQVMHDLPYAEGISEDVYGDLFERLGRNEGGMQMYFTARAQTLSTCPVVAFDSTTISTYSEGQTEARQGFNKDHDGLDTIKLLTLYSVRDREPIAFAKQPGNVPDVISIENALSQLKCLGVTRPTIVTDNGYYSQENMTQFVRRNMKFLMLADPEVKWIRQCVDCLAPALDTMSSVCPFDVSVHGASMTIEHDFPFVRQRSRGGIAAGEEETITRRVQVHVFHSFAQATKRRQAFESSLLELKRQLEEGQTEFSEAARQRIRKYLILEKRGRGGRMKVSFQEKALAEKVKYFGYFALVGNQPMETFEALENYRQREKIEEAFADQKAMLGGRRPRVWHPDSLKGRLFVQFLALGYTCFLRKRLKDLRDGLARDADSLTKEQFEQEKKLARWLDGHSLAQIMDWFDCIETTTVHTRAGEMRWSTESVARDRMLLQRLGVIDE